MSFKYWTKQVAYSEDGGTTFVDLGQVRADGSENTQESASEETSAGVELYAGTDDQVTVMVNDNTKYSALALIMKDDAKQGTLQLRFTDAQGNTETRSGYSVIVQNPKNFAPRTRSPFQARFRRSFI